MYKADGSIDLDATVSGIKDAMLASMLGKITSALSSGGLGALAGLGGGDCGDDSSWYGDSGSTDSGAPTLGTHVIGGDITIGSGTIVADGASAGAAKAGAPSSVVSALAAAETPES